LNKTDTGKADTRRERPQTPAARVLAEVADGRSLSEALPAEQARAAPGQRALIQALCYGSLRHGESLGFLRDQLLSKPLPPRDAVIGELLRLALFQLLHSPSPTHRVVNDSVSASRELGRPRAAGLVNAVLRRFLRERDPQLDALSKASADIRHDLPRWLFKRIGDDWGDAEAIADALRTQPPMTLRVHLGRITRSEWLAQAEAAELPAQPGRHADSAVRLESAIDVTRLPGFDQGLVSVQDEAAQLVVPLMKLAPGLRVLDACAAPGGKTLAMLEREPALSMTALDVSATRLERVSENLARAGLTARLVSGDAAIATPDWADAPYDRILLDAPCSATGVIRRHPDIKRLRRNGDIAQLAATQASMLDTLWQSLKPGGRLVYATCSLIKDENERQIERFLERHPEAISVPIEANWGHDRQVGRQILPGEDGMDGFFHAIVEKPCDD